MNDLRFPIGEFDRTQEITSEKVDRWIEEIADAPSRLRAAVSGLTDAQLDTPYRPEGWTLRQVVHHLADSHMNSYIRIKLALTEDNPTIRTYYEDRWAELPEARTAPVELSLKLLDAIHERWTLVLRNLTPEQRARAFVHPDSGATPLDMNIGIYAWHGNHHIAHITSARGREGW